jgi:hypothetical protein
MSSSPRFWQKLGLGKQQKTSSSSSTVNSGTLVTRFRNIKAQAQFFFFLLEKQDGISIHSSISFHHVQEAALSENGKAVKRFR